ncbi:MAG: hypothetical protein V3S64_09840 [bacterium]
MARRPPPAESIFFSKAQEVCGLSPEKAVVAIERALDCQTPPEKMAATVAEALQARLGLRIGVECHEKGTLPRYEGKAQRVPVR